MTEGTMVKDAGQNARSDNGQGRILFAALLGLAAAGSAGAVRAEEAPQRSRLDQDNLAWMQSAHPAAADELLRGEALLANAKSGTDIEKAAELFKAASAEAPEGWLAPRRLCQAYTALGRHAQAVAACEDTLNKSGTALSLRAAVGALMSGPAKPTAEEMGRAMIFARRATELVPNEPWGYAAWCDIAVKIGDAEMFDDCAERLEAIAPNHYETDRVRTEAASIRPGVGVLAGWALVVLAALGTAMHAARRAFRGGLAARRAGGVALLVALGALSMARGASAAADDDGTGGMPSYKHGLSKFPISDTDPVSSVPPPEKRDEDPLNYGYFLMDLGYKAVSAAQRGDHAAAARFYEAGIKADPDTAVPFFKACEQYEALGNLDKAAETCGAALSKPGARLADYSHYARILFDKPSGLEQKDIADLDAVVGHLKGGPDAGHAAAYDIECQLGARLDDLVRLQDCAPALAKMGPNDPKATFFQWVLAIKKKDYPAALGFVKQAKERANDPEHRAEALRMEKATLEAMPLWRKGFGFRDWRVGATLTGLLAIGLTLLLMRRSPVSKTRDA